MIEIANLEVVYHSVLLVLKGVSITVPDRGVVALLGPNGAGKTTALRALTGLLAVHDGRVTGGDVRWGGESLVGRRPDAIVRKGIAQVMEGRRVLADLTVEENLLAGAYAVSRAAAREAIDRAWARFPVLCERRRQQAGYLSGGEQQMLAIARALMSGPRLLVMDEPSLGLAPKVVADVGRMIAEIHERDGAAVLLVEQNAALALSLASYGYIMDNGRIVLDGPAERLREDRDIREFYMGMGRDGHRSYREVKHYRRRKRWLS
ncbi:MAG: ABC transporter ATP-binding protein [Myxococcota bacterium]|nr:ABC transporter ATP-binding protein [Myxococcota bacterium]